MTKSSPSAEDASPRRTRWIVRIAAAVYALTLVLAWICGDMWMDGKSEELLRTARDTFSSYLEEDLHSVQWFQANLVFDTFGWTNAAPRSVADMQAVAERFYVDELNIVSTNGIVIASNLPKVVGDDWRRHPQTAAFLEMLSPTSSMARMAIPRMAQPFRHGTINPDFYCAYFAEAFMDRSGLLQLGYRMERLIDIMAYSDCKNIREWDFGRYGHFTAIDMDGDCAPDRLPAGADEDKLTQGVLARVIEEDERAYRLTFAYAGHLFAAIVPEREYGEQRLYGFVVFAATSAILIFLFTLVLVRLSHAARKVAALHREAEERTAADLAIARKIQLSSLPDVDAFALDDLSFSLAAMTRPAREVGGDYYDFFRAPDGRVALVIADVSGKGIPAALFMHAAKHAFAEALRTEGSLVAAVVRMNEELCARNEAEMFVTAWFGLLDAATGAIEYVNAGHNRPYLLPADGSVERLDARGGRFLGMFREATYRSSRLALRPGDRLVLYTDGVTEAMNAQRRPYGDKRLVSLLKTAPVDLVKAITDDVAAYVGDEDQSDDLTLLVVTWSGLPHVEEQVFPVAAETTGEALAFVRQHVDTLDGKRRIRLLNAVDEWIANVVTHSDAGHLKVSVAHAPGRCRVVLSDDGVAYDPLQHRDPDTHLAIDERPVGGLGILMMKKLVDAVTHRRDGAWNVLSLSLKLVEGGEEVEVGS